MALKTLESGVRPHEVSKGWWLLLSEHFWEKVRDEKTNESNQRGILFSGTWRVGEGKTLEMKYRIQAGHWGREQHSNPSDFLLIHHVPYL